MEDLTRPLSRRELLRISAAGAGFATLGPFLAACGGDDSEPTASSGDGGRGGELKMWWWGEQEAVGIQSWVDATLGKFKTANGTAVTPTLMDTANVVPQFTNAAAAGKPPDVQFLFNGIYHMENVWLGYIEPLTGLVDQAVLDKSGATKMSVYEGKQYRVGFYSVPFGIAYNKAHFDDAFAGRFERDRLPKAAGPFAVGRETLEARYRAEELIDLPAPQLLAIGERELETAERSFIEAAARIDPRRPALSIWEQVLQDHPKRGALVPAAQKAVDALQAFVTSKGLVSLPSTEPVIVAAAPPYDLGLASMHSSPPLEATPVKSYFYITDAQADWDAARQDAWLQKFNIPTLTVITSHQVMPGHYVHSLFMRKTPGQVSVASGLASTRFRSRRLARTAGRTTPSSWCSTRGSRPTTRATGWPQLSEAMTRICRLISGIQLHRGPGPWTRPPSSSSDRAHLPPPAARQEAERGTYDPTYGGYFLGKVQALKLRDDVRARKGASFDLRRFHERVMTNGIAPWWAHRQLLLPGDTASLLE